jgi:hypothetical protein
MYRDRELTGHKRGQSVCSPSPSPFPLLQLKHGHFQDDPEAPLSFKELKVEYHQ